MVRSKSNKINISKWGGVKFKVKGTITLNEAIEYVRGLKMYVLKMGTTMEEKSGIENEINQWELYIEVLKKITKA